MSTNLHSSRIQRSIIWGLQIAVDIASLQDTGFLCLFPAHNNSQPCMGLAKSNIVGNACHWSTPPARPSSMHSKNQQGTAFARLILQGSTSQQSTLSQLSPLHHSRFQRSIVWGLIIEMKGTATQQGMRLGRPT